MMYVCIYVYMHNVRMKVKKESVSVYVTIYVDKHKVDMEWMMMKIT